MNLLGACFSSTKALRPSDWQLAVLLTRKYLNAPYVWDVNEGVARLLPTFQPWEKFECLIPQRDLSDATLFTDRQRMIGRFCEEVHSPANVVSEQTMGDLQKVGDFDDAQIMELFMVSGIYGTVAQMVFIAKIDFDEPIPALRNILSETFQYDIERQQRLLDEEAGRIR